MKKYRKTIEIKELKDSGVIRAVIATLNVIDKDGDVTLPGAFGEQEVVVVPAHDWSHIPIGKGVIREEGNQAIAEIQMNMGIASGQEWFTALKFDLEKGKPLQEWSYGFNIREGGVGDGEMDGRRVRFLRGLTDGRPGLEVHEVSPVLVGAGQNTGTLYAKGLKTALPAHDTPTVDRPWDGPENVRRAREEENEAYYAHVFAWKNPQGDSGAKSSYKFPHHEVSANGDPGAANVRGLIAGIAVLNGGRGGADIPDADRSGVYNHLAKHLRDAGVEPPPLKEATPPAQEEEMVMQTTNAAKGKRFCDEADAALEAVGHLAERAKSLADLRAKDGRSIAQDSRERLLNVMKALQQASTAIAGVLTPEDHSGDLVKEMARFEKNLAQTHTGGSKR
jgi:hypothetical protein